MCNLSVMVTWWTQQTRCHRKICCTCNRVWLLHGLFKTLLQKLHTHFSSSVAFIQYSGSSCVSVLQENNEKWFVVFFFSQIKSLRLKPHTHDDRGSSPAWITCFVHANNNQKPDYQRTASGTKTSRGQERLQASLLAKWFPPKNDWKFCLRVCSSGAQRDCDSFSNIEAISWKRVKKIEF